MKHCPLNGTTKGFCGNHHFPPGRFILVPKEETL